MTVERMQRRVDRARQLERMGRYAAARSRYERALRLLAPGVPAPVTAAALLRGVGSTHRAEGDVTAATDCFEASLASARCAGSDVDRAHALNWLGMVAQEQGHADEAVSLYDSAMALAEGAGDARLIAMVVQNRGVMATVQGEPELAQSYYSASLRLVQELGDTTSSATLLNNLGVLHLQLAQWDDAASVFDQCASAADELGNVHIRAMVEVNRVELHYRRGELDAALSGCHRARELATQVEHHVALGEAYRWYGTIHRGMGKLQSAEAYLDAAAEIAGRFEKGLLSAEVQREMALLYREQDRNHEALQALSRAHAVLRELRALPLLRDVEGSLRELEEIYLDVVRRWSESIEQKDRYTSGHCQRVADYACTLARDAGLDPVTITWFRMGALLHDVGKIAIPAEVLNKNGALSETERAIIERHPVIGDEMLASMSFPWDIRPMVRGHHERWDGTGYPDRTAGLDIPLSARILCIADVYDALTTDRPYRPGFTPERAMGIMQRESGRMFDPGLFPLFASRVTAGGFAGETDVMAFAAS
ncbi:MAG TPA: HD domain-containing phosphohydrolase [Longimicrobiales bacterium]|nr:HD domain-containing phosphohydrolase [Longimicrobiales bacterium]